jgi:TRAP-type C4-dicarboxylate transport system permease small subunit
LQKWQLFVDWLVGTLKRLGAAALAGMMLLTCLDVILRKMGSPIFGAVEIVSLLATVVLACAMPQTHLERGHVGVDLVMRKLTDRTQDITDAFTALAATILFGLVSWQMFVYAAVQKRSGEVSMSLELPTYAFVYLVAIAFSVLTLVIATDCLNKFRRALG